MNFSIPSDFSKTFVFRKPRRSFSTIPSPKVTFTPLSLFFFWTSAMSLPLAGGGGTGDDLGRGTALRMRTPYIEPPHQLNLTVALGQTAFLHCPVKFLGDKTVSWIRRRDLHILTSGNHIFTSDPRVSLLRDQRSWTLRLERVRRSDDSPYECQINTEPKMRLAIFLNVVGSQNDEWVVPPLEAQLDYRLRPNSAIGEARILGGTNLRAKLGGPLELTCLASHSDPGPDITWFQNEIPIKPSSRSGLEIQTTKGQLTTLSTLRVNRVELVDGGKYSCGGRGLESRTFVVVSPVQGHEPPDYDSGTDVSGDPGGHGSLSSVQVPSRAPGPSAHSGTSPTLMYEFHQTILVGLVPGLILSCFLSTFSRI